MEEEATPHHPASRGHAATRPNGMLHLMQYRSLLTAAAGGAAAFADVAAAGRAHLGPAGEAQRGVRRPALLELDQLGGAVRAAVRAGRARRGLAARGRDAWRCPRRPTPAVRRPDAAR